MIDTIFDVITYISKIAVRGLIACEVLALFLGVLFFACCLILLLISSISHIIKLINKDNYTAMILEDFTDKAEEYLEKFKLVIIGLALIGFCIGIIPLLIVFSPLFILYGLFLLAQFIYEKFFKNRTNKC